MNNLTASAYFVVFAAFAISSSHASPVHATTGSANTKTDCRRASDHWSMGALTSLSVTITSCHGLRRITLTRTTKGISTSYASKWFRFWEPNFTYGTVDGVQVSSGINHFAVLTSTGRDPRYGAKLNYYFTFKKSKWLLESTYSESSHVPADGSFCVNDSETVNYLAGNVEHNNYQNCSLANTVKKKITTEHIMLSEFDPSMDTRMYQH